MKKRKKRLVYIAIGLLVSFVLWTGAVCLVDVRPVGPQNSLVGFATLNQLIHDRTGVHMPLYVITDWLGLVPIGFVMAFAVLGLAQWIQRKHLFRVERSILVLGVFYLVVLAAYVLFECVAVNYRPVLIGGRLEASYPSSTTMLVLCVMPTVGMQLHARIRDIRLKRCAMFAITAFTVFMVVGRLVSGVHWFTDIIGGTLLSAGLATMYCALIE